MRHAKKAKKSVLRPLRKGSARGQVVIEIHVEEHGTFVLNRLWFGTNQLVPYWFGTDVGDRNLLGLGIAVGGGFIYAAHGNIEGGRDQWAGEVRVANSSLRGTRWGVMGSMTLVHGSEPFRVSGAEDDTSIANFHAFPYRRFGGRWGVTYDFSALTRVSVGTAVVPPGCDSFVRHVHRHDEEWMFVLSGSGAVAMNFS